MSVRTVEVGDCHSGAFRVHGSVVERDIHSNERPIVKLEVISVVLVVEPLADVVVVVVVSFLPTKHQPLRLCRSRWWSPCFLGLLE